MSSVTIEELMKLPKLSEFRFDVELENYEGEKEDVISALITDVVERSNGVDITLCIPEPASTGFIASLVTSLQNITAITVSHNRSDDTILFSTLHRVIAFNGWKIEGHADKTGLCPLTASYATEASFPIMQPIEGLKEWLEKKGDE